VSTASQTRSQRESRHPPWFSFSRVLPLLPEEYHVFALDLRGHGESDRPTGGYRMDAMATDVLAFMDATGLQRAVIVGHSMGSVIAQQVALAAPGRVSGLVLVAAVTTPRNINGIDEFRTAVQSLADPVPEEFVREFQVSTIFQSVPDSFLDRVVSESMKLPAHVWRAVIDGLLATDPPTRLRRTPIPTLILWGDRDTMFPGSEQNALLAMIPGARLEVYRETGHACTGSDRRGSRAISSRSRKPPWRNR
jgi:pimeloyl-ACP methyl ester carboxylesterase